MTTWTNCKFIEAFSENELGRKTTYGNLWVVDSPTCRILMSKFRHGEEIVGIYLKSNDEKIHVTIFNDYNSSWKNSNSRKYGVHTRIFSDDVTESELIEYDDTILDGIPVSALFKIGNQRYFYEPNWGFNGQRTKYGDKNPWPYFRSYSKNADTLCLFKLEEKISSIGKARELIVPEEVKCNPETAFRYNKWWFIPTPDFIPPNPLTSEEIRILENPPLLLKYGLNKEIASEYYESPDRFELLNESTREKILKPTVHRNLISYMKDKKEWGKLKEKIESKEDTGLSEITVLPIDVNEGKIIKISSNRFMIKGTVINKPSHFFSSHYFRVAMEQAVNKNELKGLFTAEDWHLAIRINNE